MPKLPTYVTFRNGGIYLLNHQSAAGYVTYSSARLTTEICTFNVLKNYLAPKDCKAILSSLTAVGTSSKFNAEIAHLACFCADMMASSSVLKGPC